MIRTISETEYNHYLGLPNMRERLSVIDLVTGAVVQEKDRHRYAYILNEPASKIVVTPKTIAHDIKTGLRFEYLSNLYDMPVSELKDMYAYYISKTKQTDKKEKTETEIPLTDEQKDIIRIKANAGATAKEIAETAKIPEKSVKAQIKETEKPTDHRRNTDPGKIMALVNAGWPVTKIADEMKCATQTVYNIIKRSKNVQPDTAAAEEKHTENDA